VADRAEGNVNGLRVVERTIVSGYFLSEDDLLLMGRQDLSAGGTWPRAWRIPGGGNKPGETLRGTMIREGEEEVVGLDLAEHELVRLPITANDAHEKTLESGETVWQKMEFYHFMARLRGVAAEFDFQPGGDLVELDWFDREERARVEQIPIGKGMMLRAGLIDPPAFCS
jgi:ADP-ribose pyrophosphatase YjhB (NUDIX family)